MTWKEEQRSWQARGMQLSRMERAHTTIDPKSEPYFGNETMAHGESNTENAAWFHHSLKPGKWTKPKYVIIQAQAREVAPRVTFLKYKVKRYGVRTPYSPRLLTQTLGPSEGSSIGLGGGPKVARRRASHTSTIV